MPQLGLFEGAPQTSNRSRRVVFNSELAKAAKAKGMALAAENRRKVLGLARDLALEYAKAHGGLCDIDSVQATLIKRGYDPNELGNAAGSVFLRPKWEYVDRKQSERASNRDRWISIWRLR